MDANNIECDKTETATGAKVTFTNLTLGYYLVDTSLGSLCSLNTTAPSVTIKEKNSNTTIEKKIVTAGGDTVDSNSAGIGDNKLTKPIEVKITATPDANTTGVSETVEYEK